MADINLTFGADDLKKVVAEIQKAAKSLNAALKKTGTITTEDAAKAKKLAKTAKLLAAEKKKINTVDRERIKIAKQLDVVNSKLALANSKEARTLAAKKKQLRDINRQLITGGKNTNTWGKALGSFQFKFNALGNIAANVTRSITRGFSRAIKNIIKEIADFDQAIADVGAIANASQKQMDKFRESALALGGATKFTAIEVAKLQKELAKLGFTTTQIVDMQAAILDIASASSTELPRSAEVVGTTLRAFGLDAKEATRVVNVMAESFTTSGLDLERFAESMKIVAPVAKAAGVSLEETTAMLGVLANSGIIASMAGTQMRQMFLELVGNGGNLNEILNEMSKRDLTLADAKELVGQRAAAAFLVLKDGVGTVDEMTKALVGVGDTAQDLAEKKLDTLIGQTTILTSAWSRFTLHVTESESGFRGIKSILGGFASLMNNFVDASNALASLGGGQAGEFLSFFLDELEGKDHAGQVKALGEEIEFIKREINEYGQVLSETNVQLANTKRREKDARESLEQKQGAAEGMIRIYELYLELLQDIVIEEEKVTTEYERELGVLGKLQERLKFLKDEREFASIEELTAIDDEIAKIDAKIDAINRLNKTFAKPTPEDDSFGATAFDVPDSDAVERRKEGNDQIEADYQAHLANLQNMSDEKLEDDIEREEEEIEAFKRLQERKREIAAASFEAAKILGDALVQIRINELDAELKAVEGNAEELKEVQKQQAKERQELAIKQTLINTAVGIGLAFAQYGWPAGIIPAALTLAAGVAQIGVIKSQQFAEGEVDIKGPSHSKGGIQAEIEGGESVINKRSTQKYKSLLEAINQDDQMRIMDAMNRDRKMIVNQTDPYNQKMYELMSEQVQYGEDNDYYYKHKGNLLVKTPKK